MADWNGLSNLDETADTFTKIRNLLLDAIILEKSSITNPVDGMVCLNRSTSGFEIYDSGTMTWVPFSFGLAGGGHGGSDASSARTGLGLGTVATKNTITTADITDGAVTVAKTTGFGALAVKSSIATADIANGAVTPAKSSGFGALALLSVISEAYFTGSLPTTKGGCGGTDAATNRAGIGAAASGANADITALTAFAGSSWYPAAFYVPTPGASGATSITFAQYKIVGQWVDFQINGSINITTSHDEILVRLPKDVAVVANTKWQSGAGSAFIPGVGVRGLYWRTSGTQKDVLIKRMDDAAFPAISGVEISIGGSYIAVP